MFFPESLFPRPTVEIALELIDFGGIGRCGVCGLLAGLGGLLCLGGGGTEGGGAEGVIGG